MERVNVSIPLVTERYITLDYLPDILFVNVEASQFGLLRLSAGDCALAQLLAKSQIQEPVEDVPAPLHSTNVKR